MAAPTFDEITTTQFSDNIARVNALEVWINATYDPLEITTIQNQESDFSVPTLAAVDADRAAIASPLDPASLRAWMEPIIFQIGRTINSPAQSVEGIWKDLYDHMDTNTLTVNDPEDTYASGGTFTGTGTGSIYRITVDENAEKLLGWLADTYTVECELDARQLGVSHEEVFTFKGQELAKDEGKRTGTGISTTITTVSERDSARYVQNPAFNTFTGTAPTASTPTVLTTGTEFTGWTVATPGSAYADIDTVFRTVPGGDSTAQYSLEFDGNNTVSQDLVDVNGTQIDPDVPYEVGIWVYRENTADGNYTFSLGGVSTGSTAVSTLTNAQWNYVQLTTPGQNSWPANFNANSLTLTFQLASNTTGSLFLGPVIFAPYTRIGGNGVRGRGGMGQYFCVVGGATPFVKGDTKSLADSFGGTRGQVAYWSAVAGLGYLPSTTGGTETWSD